MSITVLTLGRLQQKKITHHTKLPFIVSCNTCLILKDINRIYPERSLVPEIATNRATESWSVSVLFDS